MAWAAVVFLLAAGCAAIAGWLCAAAAGILLIIILFVLIRNKIICKNAYLLVLIYFCSYIYLAHHFAQSSDNSPVDEFHKISAAAQGQVMQIQQKESGTDIVLYGLEIETQERADISCSGLLVHVYDPKLALMAQSLLCPGDRIRVAGELAAFPAARNDGGFNSPDYYRSIGVQYCMTAEQLTDVQKNQGIKSVLARVKRRLASAFEDIAMETDAAVLKAVVLGDKSGLNEELKQQYQRNGIAHLLAISGLHVSLIGMLLYRLLRKCGAGYLFALTVGAAVLSGYAVMTGNGISVRRAVLMCVLSMGAEAAGRTYDLLSALSLSFILIVKDNLWVLYNAGFQLSFGAILGIALLSPVLNNLFLSGLEKKRSRLDRKTQAGGRWLLQMVSGILKGFTASLSVSLMTLPVIMYHYFEVPVYSVFLNLMVIPLMSLLMLCALAAGGAALVCLPAGTFFVGTVHFILNIFSSLCGLSEQLPGSRLVTGQPALWQCGIYYALFFIFLLVAGFRIQKRKFFKRVFISAGKAGLVIGALAVLLSRFEPNLVIDMIDVGQGDCIMVQTPDHSVYLFDGGSSDVREVGTFRIYPFLRAKAVTEIESIFISHSDEDHINGIEELLACIDTTFRIKNLVLPGISGADEDENYCRLRQKAAESGVNIIYAQAGEQMESTTYRSGQTLSLKCLHPQKEIIYESANDYSAVYLLKYGSFSMLLTGDLEEKGEKEILAYYPAEPVSVLKTAHHGSKTSTSEAWLKKIHPKLALISCGIRNRYGHPAPQIIERLAECKTDVFVTALCGQITIKTDGKRFGIRTKF